jgi:hypothetical protein
LDAGVHVEDFTRRGIRRRSLGDPDVFPRHPESGANELNPV